MSRLLSEQDSSPLERSKFDLDEIEGADEAYVKYEGWVEIDRVSLTDKGYTISFSEYSEKLDIQLENSVAVDDIKKLR